MYRTMKIYYLLENGEIVWLNSYNFKTEVNFDKDYDRVKALQQYKKDSIGLLVLKDEAYAESFQTGQLIKIDTETLTPVFEYPNPENPEEPMQGKPLNIQIDELRIEQAQANIEMVNLILSMKGGE